jgi:importin subunit alpha-6/7
VCPLQAVVEAGVAPDLVRLLGHSQTQVVSPALRTLGNLVSGDDSQTQAVLDAGALVMMPALLGSAKKSIRKETCWLLSNVAAGNHNQISTLTHTKGVLPMVMNQLLSGEWEVKREAAWVVSNIATGGNRTHIQQLVESGAIKPLCNLLDVQEVKVVDVTLDAIAAVS